MEDRPRDSPVVRFGVFEVDLRTGELRRKGLKVGLQEQPFRILALLLEHPGELVTREQLRRELWPGDVVVEFDQGLNNAIKKLRHALDDSAETPRLIETLPRRGYRFIAPVEISSPDVIRATTEPTRPQSDPRRRIWLGVALAALVGVGAAALLARFQRSHADPAARGVMLAVLPFENLSGDREQEYFSDGITEELIAQLGRLHAGRLRVIGRASAMKFRSGDQDDIGRIVRELNVEYLLRGTVRRSGDRVRVTAVLIRARDQTQIWTRTFDQQLRDILGLQIEVAQAVAREIPIGGRPPVPRPEDAASHRPVNSEAYQAYLKGRYFWNKFEAPAFWKARDYFQRSIELDPDYAPAHAGLSASYGLLSVVGEIPSHEAQPKAGAEARRALELDDAYAPAHVQLGFFQLNYLWDFAGAKRSFERAVELDPSSSAALHADATAFVVQDQFEPAFAQVKRAIEVDPLWLLPSADFCTFLYFARRYEDAIAQCRRTLEMDPNFPPAHYYLAQIYETTGRHDEAFREYQTVVRGLGGDPAVAAAGQQAYDSGGWNAVARKWLEIQLAVRKKTSVPAFYIATSYLRLGEKDAALEWLEKACEERHYEVVFLKVSPKFDLLRSDPRFERLLKRMGLVT